MQHLHPTVCGIYPPPASSKSLPYGSTPLFSPALSKLLSSPFVIAPSGELTKSGKCVPVFPLPLQRSSRFPPILPLPPELRLVLKQNIVPSPSLPPLASRFRSDNSPEPDAELLSSALYRFEEPAVPGVVLPAAVPYSPGDTWLNEGNPIVNINGTTTYEGCNGEIVSTAAVPRACSGLLSRIRACTKTTAVLECIYWFARARGCWSWGARGLVFHE